MGMPAALGTARHIVEIVYPLYRKGNVIAPFDEGQVAPWIRDLGKIDNIALLDRQILFPAGKTGSLWPPPTLTQMPCHWQSDCCPLGAGAAR